MEAVTPQKKGISDENISNWFDKFINNISSDRLMIETNTAPKEIDQFYKDAILEDYDAVSKTLRDQSTKYFIKNLVQYYLTELKTFKVIPQKLAFDFSNAKILVWAQIANEDEKAEDALILSEARANNKYAENGFFVSSTIVEEGDGLKIPPHYHEVKFDGGLPGSY